MKVVFLLFFIILLGYQIYLNLKNEEAPVGVPTHSTGNEIPAKNELPGDLPSPAKRGTGDEVSGENPSLNDNYEYRDMTLLPAKPDIGSEAEMGEPPASDMGSFLDHGSKLAPTGDNGSFFVPGKDSGS